MEEDIAGTTSTWTHHSSDNHYAEEVKLPYNVRSNARGAYAPKDKISAVAVGVTTTSVVLFRPQPPGLGVGVK